MEHEHPRGPRIGPGVAVGIDEAVIRDMVHGFYGKVRKDAVLGPIFAREVDDWDPHLAKMCDFWSSVLLTTGRFKGRPVATHARLPDLTPAHFSHWLGLFRQTAAEVCTPDAAAVFVAKAELIAESLQLGVAASRGEIPPLGATAR